MTEHKLHLVPVTFAGAKAFVNGFHRDHRAPVGNKFSVGVASGGTLAGVAIVWRPVARHYNDGSTLEVTRSCTDGTPNANSMLYGAAARATFALGYSRLITYTQEDESGASLKGAGFRVVAQRAARAGWSTPTRPRSTTGTENIKRTLWEVREV